MSPRASQKTEKRPSFYTNPIAPNSGPQNGQITIEMETIQEGAEPTAYEEPEDEVQEVKIYSNYIKSHYKGTRNKKTKRRK